MWNPDGVGWILFTFGIDALIVAAILLAVPEVSIFLKSEVKLRKHVLARLHELHEAGEITTEDFDILQHSREML